MEIWQVPADEDLAHAKSFFAQTEGWLEGGRIADIIQSAQQQIKQARGYTAPRILLALAYLNQNRVAEARAEVEQIRRPLPEWSSVYSTLGAVAFTEKKLCRRCAALRTCFTD